MDVELDAEVAELVDEVRPSRGKWVPRHLAAHRASGMTCNAAANRSTSVRIPWWIGPVGVSRNGMSGSVRAAVISPSAIQTIGSRWLSHRAGSCALPSCTRLVCQPGPGIRDAEGVEDVHGVVGERIEGGVLVAGDGDGDFL